MCSLQRWMASTYTLSRHTGPRLSCLVVGPLHCYGRSTIPSLSPFPQTGLGPGLENPSRQFPDQGTWTAQEAPLHVNIKELWAVCRACKVFLPHLVGKVVQIFMDNIATMVCVKCLGGGGKVGCTLPRSNLPLGLLQLAQHSSGDLPLPGHRKPLG